MQDSPRPAHQLVVIGIHENIFLGLAQKRVVTHYHIRRTVCVSRGHFEQHRRRRDILDVSDGRRVSGNVLETGET